MNAFAIWRWPSSSGDERRHDLAMAVIELYERHHDLAKNFRLTRSGLGAGGAMADLVCEERRFRRSL
jgi:hypothetical protein